MEEKVIEIQGILEGLNDSEIIEIFNKYCETVNYCDDIIYDNDDDFLDNNFQSPSECIKVVNFSNYSYNHKYVQFNGYGNMESTNDVGEFISYSELADYIVRNDEDFNNDEIREALDEDEDEIEDEY
jgi:hypothetical protein